jgi:hypothetical protein
VNLATVCVLMLPLSPRQVWHDLTTFWQTQAVSLGLKSLFFLTDAAPSLSRRGRGAGAGYPCGELGRGVEDVAVEDGAKPR